MKTRRKILIAAGIFLLLLAGSMIFSAHVQPENSVSVCKKMLRDKGEKMQITELMPPPVPAESNSVDAVEDAFQLLASSSGNIPEGMKMVAPGKAMVGWAQPEACGLDFTNSWEEFAAEITAEQPAIELLHQALDRPCLDFQIDCTKGIDLLLPHLAPMKRAAQMLDAAAICELHFGDTGAATTNILTMLGLVQKNSSDRLLISHLVHIAIVAIAVPPTWELLQHTKDTEAQLAALQQGWEQLDFLDDAENAFVTERAVTANAIEKLRSSPTELQKIMTSGVYTAMSGAPASESGWEVVTEKPRNFIGEVMWCSSWSYFDELSALKGDTIIIDALRTMQTNRSQFYKADYDAIQSKLAAIGITNTGEAFFRALNIPDFSEIFGDSVIGSAVERTLRIEAARRVLVTAIALKRFQLRNGHWPQTLYEMAPEFLASVPIDPYDGKPLRYHLNADGTFLLYCVGDDGVDDGGDPTQPPGIKNTTIPYWQYGHVRDWVWPQPATAAEIQKYYEDQAKKATY